MSIHHAVIRQLKGITFAGKSDSNHWIVMDGPEIFEGSEAGSRPKELLLLALGGCNASNIIPILKKKRVPVEGFEINIKGTVREEHPQVYTDIHLEYIFYGEGINSGDVERAIELSTTKYCPISAMLKGNVKITDSYIILPSKKAGVPEEMFVTR